MNLEEYISLLESPASVDASHINDLRALLNYAPYCASARLLLLKALYDSGSSDYQAELERAMLAVPPQTSVYFLLNPKKVKRSSTVRRPKSEASISYFDMLQKMQEVADTAGLSFDEIVQRYISTREYVK